MLKKQNQPKQAVISLTTVLVVSAVLLASGITLLLTTIDFAENTKGFDNGMVATIEIRTCLEESLNKLKPNHAYNGSFSVTFTNGSCEAIVTTDLVNSNLKLIAITSSYNQYYASKNYQVDISQSPFNIIS